VDVYAIAAGRQHHVALAYNPLLMYPVDVSKDLLLIVNTHSADSTNVLNYYLAHRPGVSNANVLRISTPEGGPVWLEHSPQITNATYEMCSYTNYLEDIQTPYLSWLTNHPTKRPRYVLMMYHVPSRWDISRDGWYGACVARSLSAAVPAHKPFITHLNMRTVEDCLAYIDKLKTFGDLYSPGKVVISASEGGYGNTNYLVDNKRWFGRYHDSPCVSNAFNALVQSSIPSQNIRYVDGDWGGANPANLCRQCPETPERCIGCNGIAAYVSWGIWGFEHGDWTQTMSFLDGCNWYIMSAVESWNGQWGNAQGLTRDWQYTFHRWLESNAFRGTNYRSTPVGALSHTAEPGQVCSIAFDTCFRLWSQGKPFALCVWNAAALSVVQATGDPLVRR
jgi:hypothetical protein